MEERENYAGFWIRLVALLIDTAILMIPIFIITIVLTVMFSGVLFMGSGIGEEGILALAFGGNLVITIILYIIQAVYFILQESSSHQATFGKRAVGIKVYNKEGNRLTKMEATARYLSKILSGILYIGYIMAGLTKKKQGLHDFIVGTYVVKENK